MFHLNKFLLLAFICAIIFIPSNTFSMQFLSDLKTKVYSFFNKDFSIKNDTVGKKAITRDMHEKIMNYPIPQVIARYKKDYNVSDELAKVHERELKRYFILCGTYPEELLMMFSPEVDNLWHTFILYTKDYKKFCKEVFGYFMHHCPTE